VWRVCSRIYFPVGNTAQRDISQANYAFFRYNNNNILRYYFLLPSRRPLANCIFGLDTIGRGWVKRFPNTERKLYFSRSIYTVERIYTIARCVRTEILYGHKHTDEKMRSVFVCTCDEFLRCFVSCPAHNII